MFLCTRFKPGFLSEEAAPKMNTPTSGKLFTMPQSNHSLSIVRIFTNFELSELDISHILSGFRAEDSLSRLEFNKSGPCNLAIVINFSKRFQFVWGKEAKVVKWLMEPTVSDRINMRFTWVHSRIFSKIYAHNATSSRGREEVAPPMVPPHVPSSDPQNLVNRKNKLVSAIGSRQQALDFHRVRTQILDAIEKDENLDIGVFGKGRTFIPEKIEGLRDFRYSIAIENSLTDNYWTEKLSDCFLAMTVPIYLGAPNASDFFPVKSMIRVSEEQLTSGLSDLLGQLSKEDYESRIPDLLRARELVLSRYSFGREAARMLNVASVETGSSKKIQRVWNLDTLIALLFRIASRAKSYLKSAR